MELLNASHQHFIFGMRCCKGRLQHMQPLPLHTRLALGTGAGAHRAHGRVGDQLRQA